MTEADERAWADNLRDRYGITEPVAPYDHYEFLYEDAPCRQEGVCLDGSPRRNTVAA